VSKNFIPADRDQALLMPPSLGDWLPKDHLAWFVLETVAELDLSRFYRRYRDDGWGRAAFEPSMMVALLLYAYALGVRSSREIERRLTEDVAFRVVAANNRPDHTTICRFRQTYEHALNELFISVLSLCVRAGMVRTEVIAIDGTKIAANASGAKNVTDEQLRDFAARVFEEAAAIDAEEDRLYGDKRGDEMPEHLEDRHQRIEWIREQLASQGKTQDNGKKPARINTTDPDSKPMKTPTGFLQGFNAQVAVTEGQVIVAADLTNQAPDTPHFGPMVDRVVDNLDAAGANEPPGAVVADAGYYSDANATLDRGPEVFIAPLASRTLRSTGVCVPPRIDDERDRARYEKEMGAVNKEVDHRTQVIRRVVKHSMTSRQAATELGLSTDRVWQLKHAFLRQGRDGLMPRPGALPRPPKAHRPSTKEVMLAKILGDRGRTTYAMRARCAEPVFGQLKEVDGLRRFSRRGVAACLSELLLQSTTHNLKKLWRHRRLTTTDPSIAYA
jgi:transposase